MKIKTKQFATPFVQPTLEEVQKAAFYKFGKIEVTNPSKNTFNLKIKFSNRTFLGLIYIVKQIGDGEYNFELSLEIANTRWKVSFPNSGTLSSCMLEFSELIDELGR